MKPLDELMADWRRTIAWMEEQVRESGKRIVPLTPEQQLEHEQMVRVLMEEREQLRASEAARPSAVQALARAGQEQVRHGIEFNWIICDDVVGALERISDACRRSSQASIEYQPPRLYDPWSPAGRAAAMRARLQKAGISTTFDMIWRSR